MPEMSGLRCEMGYRLAIRPLPYGDEKGQEDAALGCVVQWILLLDEQRRIAAKRAMKSLVGLLVCVHAQSRARNWIAAVAVMGSMAERPQLAAGPKAQCFDDTVSWRHHEISEGTMTEPLEISRGDDPEVSHVKTLLSRTGPPDATTSGGSVTSTPSRCVGHADHDFAATATGA